MSAAGGALSRGWCGVWGTGRLSPVSSVLTIVSPTACLLRSNALSLVYLLFLLLLPWFPGPSQHSIRGEHLAGALPTGRGLRAQSSSSVCAPSPGTWGRELLCTPQKPWAAKDFLCGFTAVGKS